MSNYQASVRTENDAKEALPQRLRSKYLVFREPTTRTVETGPEDRVKLSGCRSMQEGSKHLKCRIKFKTRQNSDHRMGRRKSVGERGKKSVASLLRMRTRLGEIV